MQFFKPENYFEVRKALEQAGRQDLIGDGCDCLIPERAAEGGARPAAPRANEAVREQTGGDHIRSRPAPAIGPSATAPRKRDRGNRPQA